MPDTAQNYITSVLIGIIDGIIIPLTVYCFLIGLGKHPGEVWNYTLYIVTFTALILAAGGFFTRKEELSHTHQQRILNVYKGLDVPGLVKEELIKDAQRENDEWKETWDAKDAAAEPLPPFKYAAAIFIGCIAGGIVVLINALEFVPPGPRFFVVPVFLLMIAGLLKYRFFGRPAFGGMLLTGGAGLLAAAGGYWIATFL
ncbi:MAG: VIT1/CCC1 transporter family protein [Niabella sp.]|nr:VIT1/CCC1 transporter family protein [Niabella sp.]